MAADTVYVQGRNLLIYVNGKPVGCSKTATLEITTAVSNSTTKCDVDPVTNALWTHNSPEENSWKLTDSGTIPIQNSAGMATEFAARAIADFQIAQTLVYAQLQDSLTGEWYGGNGWVTSCKLSGETTADATYDITIDGTGPLSKIPVS